MKAKIMTRPEILEIPLPDVTIEDIFRAEGADYSKQPPRPSTAQLHRQILAEAATLIRPRAIWCEVEISHAGEHELFLEEGKKLSSKLLVKAAGDADKIVFVAMTIGSELDNRVAAFNREGKVLDAFVLDAAGTAFIAKSSVTAMGKIQEHFHDTGMSTTFPMGPGHSYWSGLEDMRTIFYFLKAEQIGLRLTDSNLMMPRKSMAMAMGVGSNLPDFKGKIHCDFCNLQKTCHMTRFGENC